MSDTYSIPASVRRPIPKPRSLKDDPAKAEIVEKILKETEEKERVHGPRCIGFVCTCDKKVRRTE